jgi:hypothetical protein
VAVIVELLLIFGLWLRIKDHEQRLGWHSNVIRRLPPEIKHEPEDLRPARRERQRQLLKSYHDLEREPYDFGRPGEEADIATGGR